LQASVREGCEHDRRVTPVTGHLSAKTWDDMGLGNTSKGYVLEFE
jgi:hypothetical protein